jgi:hypothetical protein
MVCAGTIEVWYSTLFNTTPYFPLGSKDGFIGFPFLWCHVAGSRLTRLNGWKVKLGFITSQNE